MKSESASLEIDLMSEEGTLMRSRSSKTTGSSSSSPVNAKKYLILGYSAVALVIIICGIAVGVSLHNSSDPDAASMTQMSATSASLCGIVAPTTEDSSTPVVCYTLHTNTPGGNYRVVSSSITHACALSTLDTAVCWGAACDDDHPSCPAELKASKPVWDRSDEQFTAVAVGDYSTCFLRKADGTAMCRGRISVPASAAATEFVDITIENDVACGLTATSQLVCWDQDNTVFNIPALSDGILQVAASFTPPEPPMITDPFLTSDSSESQRRRRRRRNILEPQPATLAAEDQRIACAISLTHKLYCINLQPASSTATPTWSRILRSSTAAGFEMVDVYGGRGCALTLAGRIECFELASYVDPLPAMPAELADVRFGAVDVTQSAACGLSTDNSLYCWGDIWTFGQVKIPKRPLVPSGSSVTAPPTSGNNTSNATAAPGAFECPSGTRRLRDGSCEDVNECAAGTHACPRFSFCENTYGSYECPCFPGYAKESAGSETCVDIDECALDTHDCHVNATCVNWRGSFWCTCNIGFEGTGTECVDIDECDRDTHNCHEQATCTNTDPGFYCTCNAGWDGSGVNCSDVDECDLNTYNCRANSYCNNTIGSYECPCLDYYRDTGPACVDIDECGESKDHCPIDVACSNTDGYFSCGCSNQDQSFSYPADVDSFVGLTRASGLPVFLVSGFNASGYSAHLLWCDDHDCANPTVFESPVLFDEAPHANILSDDTVILAGRRVNSQVLLYRWCSDVGCTVTGTHQVDDAGYGTRVGVDSNDDIVIMTSSDTELKVMRCDAPECMWGDRLVNATNKANSPYLDMVLTDQGLPVVTHLESRFLGVFTCVDDLCSNFTGSETLATDDGFMSSIVLRTDGRAALVWRQQSSGKLMFGLCDDAACSTIQTRELTNGGYFPTIDLMEGDWLYPGQYPVITHLKSVTGTRTVQLIKCTSLDCSTKDTTVLQSTGYGGASGVFYNPISHYLYTMDEYGSQADGWRLSKHCINH
ncbi:fibulin-2 [Salpingoeca rosetta]|uniref:Fibulin-2 n=1 Tax=Salpingoeca rosetta (strain ATCC 50818 / BSB-021) TaxID=946362 RepID=F2TXB1_SALR5|nr:fibulin-2 [Salpingoeca rosetta]EGD76020.1 fibulin-2 [Salpingoeca rosetta]|eukprot:XP_004998195.1 fibulin-2 [Salpingoeca rosetta]